MQGGHHPDLGIDYYEDLFRSIKSRYKIHLHALSPPEIQHIARRSRLSIPDALTRLRDAGLDSVPGGGGEILVDRVRDVIAPKKTKSSEWLNVMRHAQRLGMSTTARKTAFLNTPSSRETKSDPDYKACLPRLNPGKRASSRRERRDRACRAVPPSCRGP